MKRNLFYIIFTPIVLLGIILLGIFVYNINKDKDLLIDENLLIDEDSNLYKTRVGYKVNSEREIIDITPVHTGYTLNITNEKGPEFDNEEDCKKRVDKEGGVCYNNANPEDWVGFYMGDTEPRPVFKTYEECEDWAISMRPYSFLKNAKGGVHVVEDGVTWCSQGCHYGYVWFNEKRWYYSCNKTIYSTRDHFDYFEKIFDKLEEGRNYERFENAFRSRVGCDIKLNYPNNPVYSYLVGIRFSYDLDEWRANVPKMHLKQKILKDEKIFYVQQYEGKIYVWGEIFDEGYGKVYSIKGDPMNLIFENTKLLFEDENIEIDCHGDFNKSPNDWKELYSLPKNITWIDGGTTDNIYQRLYED